MPLPNRALPRLILAWELAGMGQRYPTRHKSKGGDWASLFRSPKAR